VEEEMMIMEMMMEMMTVEMTKGMMMVARETMVRLVR
jgi:hypothetical protein